MLSDELFAKEYRSLCTLFCKNEKFSENTAPEYWKTAHWLSNNEFLKVVDEAKCGRYFPTLGEWRGLCTSMKIENDAEARRKLDERQAKAVFDAEATSECAGGSCGMCEREYCQTVAVASVGAIKRIFRGADPLAETMSLGEIYRGIGFEKVYTRLKKEKVKNEQ